MRRLPSHRAVGALSCLTLFGVYVLSTLAVLLLGAAVYRGVVDHWTHSATTDTALRYLTEKVRQHDRSGALAVGSVRGADALLLQQGSGDSRYTTYVFCSAGSLREVLLPAGQSPAQGQGDAILSLQRLSIRAQAKGRALCFSVIGPDGRAAQAVVCLHSAQALSARERS